MKIISVEAYPVTEPVLAPYAWRDGLPGSPDRYEITWLRIVTDEGIDGYSYIDRGAIAMDLIARCLRPLLVGQDPLKKELLWHRIWELDRIEELPIYVLGAADVALWDITAKAAGLPLHVLLGGYWDSVPAYASTATFGSIEEFLDVIDQCLAYGFSAVKLHAWGDARRDAALCQAVRDHVGPKVDLMYDASAGFTPYDALYVGRACEEAGFRWYEEPLREFSISAYRRLCDALDIPVLAAETADGCHYVAGEFILAGAADMVRTGVDFRGITGALRVAHLADAFQMTAEVHGGGLPNVHLAAAIRNNSYYEAMVLTNPITVEPGIGPDGHIRPPEDAGIGFGIDLESLRAGQSPVRAYPV
jgi:L-alanine-DL-glutamate epimerase-like enolase superfamily enzyme